jgi:threonine aldolase
MEPVFDLRSDTVTKPTAAMREAMAAAEVGDDCWGDDPTVHALEARVAKLLGKDAAVFLPSGTMANQIAVQIHCARGQTLATHVTAHVRIHEDASAAALGGVQVMPIGTRRGYDVAELEALVNQESCGWPPVGAVWLENTLGDAGGLVWPIEDLREVSAWARARRRPVHLDGARLWNAHIASRTPLPELAAIADTVSVALSKGLGAPAGSLLVGSDELVARARGRKHAMGGGMRQAGVLAAAGLWALDHHLDRLAHDHRRAAALAYAITDLPGWEVVTPETNMILARVTDPVANAEQLCAPLREAGVLCFPNRYEEVRLVVHLGIDDDAIEAIAQRIRSVVPRVVAGL